MKKLNNQKSAGAVTSDTCIGRCNCTMDELIMRVLAGEDVSSTLRSIFRDKLLEQSDYKLAKSEFEDWFNEAKIGARIYQKLFCQGKCHSEAKEMVSEVLGRYIQAYLGALSTFNDSTKSSMKFT